MADPRPRGERLFRVLSGTAIALLLAAASCGVGWEAFTGAVSEPGWMVRVSAVVWFVAIILAGIALVALFSGRRGSS